MSRINCNVDVRRMTRVEGHGNIRIEIKDGRLQRAEWQVVETPRFFEAMLRGKHFESAPWITSRICGICSIGHTLASIRAVERAFGVEPSEDTAMFRLLLKHMETLQSHVLHLYFLAAPDFLGLPSVLPLIETSPTIVKRALLLKQLANDACDLIGGRRLHPTTTIPGGFTALPDKKALAGIMERMKAASHELEKTITMMLSFEVPDFARETEYVSLEGGGSYPFIGGGLKSSDGVRRPEDEYLQMTNEYVAPNSTARWCRLTRDSFAVGALARINNNYEYLHPAARKAAEALAVRPPLYNPYFNNHAQLIECVHVVHESVDIMAGLLERTWRDTRIAVSPREGRGVSAVEVPRGILYHAYEFDREGRIVKADCVIPTGQNHGNIQGDLVKLVVDSAALGRDEEAIRRLAEMLVRSYDPCISCSVH